MAVEQGWTRTIVQRKSSYYDNPSTASDGDRGGSSGNDPAKITPKTPDTVLATSGYGLPTTPSLNLPTTPGWDNLPGSIYNTSWNTYGISPEALRNVSGSPYNVPLNLTNIQNADLLAGNVWTPVKTSGSGGGGSTGGTGGTTGTGGTGGGGGGYGGGGYGGGGGGSGAGSNSGGSGYKAAGSNYNIVNSIMTWRIATG